MEILNFIMWYLIIGTAFTFFVDLTNNWLTGKKDLINYKPPTEEDWGWGERIISIVIWPWAAYVFFTAFWKNK